MSRQPLGERLKQLLADYGPVALGVYVAIFGLVLVGFMVAISAGYDPEGVAGSAGLLGAAWVATKLTQPLRILATLALTPVVGRLVLRRRDASGDDGPAPPPPAER